MRIVNKKFFGSSENSMVILMVALCVHLNVLAETAVINTVPNTTASTDGMTAQPDLTLASNQTSIMANQSRLAQNQFFMNENTKQWLSEALTDTQARSLLLSQDEQVSQEGDNLVDQLAYVLTNSNDIEASAYMDQAISVFQALASGNTVSTERKDLMQDTVSLLLSGAGNKNASETLWVSDVLTGVDDPSQDTLSVYNGTIYPYAELSPTTLAYQVSVCSDDVEAETGASKDYCNLMKSALYTQALIQSCSSSYAAKSSDSSSASSSTSTSSQATSASSSSSTGPQYDATIYPSGFSGGCSAAYYQSQYESWNGWNTSLSAILGLQKLCTSLSPMSTSPTYSGMTASILSACSDFNSVVALYDPKLGADASDVAQDLMSDIQTPMTNIIKYARRLLVKQIFDFSMQKAIKKTPEMAYYGSLYTLIGDDSYGSESADGDAISQACVDMIREGDYTYSVETIDSTRQALASLLIQQIGSMYPQRTVLPAITLPKPSGAMAAVAINGKIVALNSTGQVMASTSPMFGTPDASSLPKITTDVTSVSSAQSSVQSAMIGASQVFQGQMDSYLKTKASTITALMDAYADRALVIKLTKGESVCQLTPAQINKFAATYRLNPNVVFADANGTGTQANWSAHLATSSSAQVAKEMALLQAQQNYQNYLLHKQNEKLALIGTLSPLMDSANQALSLKTQSLMLDKMIYEYVTGVKSSTTGSSSAMSSSSG